MIYIILLLIIAIIHLVIESKIKNFKFKEN